MWVLWKMETGPRRKDSRINSGQGAGRGDCVWLGQGIYSSQNRQNRQKGNRKMYFQ